MIVKGKRDVKQIQDAFIQIFREELIPAIGCTEPTAIAYAAARAREILGMVPEKMRITVSGDIVKNAKSAVVPNTGGMVGIRAAAAAGAIAGKGEKCLEVLAAVTDTQIEEIKEYFTKNSIEVELSKSGRTFEILAEAFYGNSVARVQIADSHTNLVYMEKDGEILLSRDLEQKAGEHREIYKLLNVKNIIAFAETVELDEVKEIILRQVAYNTAISEEGLQKNYGANIGRTILELEGKGDVRVRARAKAAAGSDARMSGSALPVVVVSGSGNQGITASVPVVEYAREAGASEELMIRSLMVSDLVAIYLKDGIGKLSAFCGAVCAGVGAACGIAFMKGGREAEISHTIVNTVGIISGMICDGAKPSCAAKIAAAVDSAIFGYEMYMAGNQFRCGDGIVSCSADETVKNIGRLGSVGLKTADEEILNMMLQSERRDVSWYINN